MDKETVLKTLKQEYPNLGLSEKVLDGVADILKETITEESKLIETVKGVETLLKNLQSDVDKERGQKVALQKELNDLKSKNETKPKEDLPEEKVKTPNASEIDAILKRLKTQEELISKMTEEKTRETRLKTIEQSLKEKHIPQSYYEPLLSSKQIDSETDIDELIKGIDESYSKLEIELSKTRFAGSTLPERGSSNINSMESLAKMINEENKKLNTKD